MSAMSDFPGCNKLFTGHRRFSHSFKAAQKFDGYVLAGRREHFGHGSVVTEHVDDECAAQIVVYAFIREQIANIKQVPRMLTVAYCE